MTNFRFQNVCIESYALHLPEYSMSSAELEDRLAPVYERLRIPFGTLEKLSGIKTRGMWEPKVAPSSVATVAAQSLLERSQFTATDFDLLVNCSVTRDYFEPATASIVHANLGMREDAFSYDITNACIGFSNAMLSMANMIESGSIEKGLIVSGENIATVVETSIRLILEKEDLTREELIRLLPTFTLGCGAAAMVLCREDLVQGEKHHFQGACARSASQFKHLCSGNGDYVILQEQGHHPLMYTESNQLILEASKLGKRLWGDFQETLAWDKDSIDHIFCHQVGKQVNEAFYKEEGLDISKEHTVYQRYGNLVSVALPSNFITYADENGFQKGEKILFTAYGSGLNGAFLGIEW